MAEEAPIPPPDVSDASTPIPPIDNIHSIPEPPPPEPMLPPAHTHTLPLFPPQPNLDIEMPEAAVRSHISPPTFPPPCLSFSFIYQPIH